MSTQSVTPTPSASTSPYPPPTPVFGPLTPVYPTNRNSGVLGTLEFEVEMFDYAAVYNYNLACQNALANNQPVSSVPIPFLSRVEADSTNPQGYVLLTDVPWIPKTAPTPVPSPSSSSPVGMKIPGTKATYDAIEDRVKALGLKNGEVYKKDPRGNFMLTTYDTPFGVEMQFVLQAHKVVPTPTPAPKLDSVGGDLMGSEPESEPEHQD